MDFSSQTCRLDVQAGRKAGRQITYTTEQAEAIRRFSEDYDRGLRRTYLVYGVTGSGKTEVYMAMIRKVVEAGRQAIVLIPEIALTCRVRRGRGMTRCRGQKRGRLTS